ncbi:DUF3090 domain-containing protein [Pseudokineococcus sp. 1T1Z-3]|uniref:DUF3090 domain-containing protein n=1 Tax=Pseudokineococcus sp. 1T1Z-3 TaxID=3132745 RepID=UPI0030B4BE99
MASQVFEYDPPDRFVAGTVGQAGSRTFFLQARSPSTGPVPAVVSVALEKQQVATLAEKVEELLDEVVRRSGGEAPVPAVVPFGATDDAPLDTPIEEEFRVGTMSLQWDGERGVVVIECFSVEDDEDAEGLGEGPEPDARSVLRVSLSGATARGFARRALAIVAAGRPPCPFCSGPLDPEGHICPRANGYRR